MDCHSYVWIFSAEGSQFPGGVFTTLDLAEAWVLGHKLSGVLTRYPIDIGVWDWAILRSHFSPRSEKHSEPDFVGRFTAATLEHYHFESGKKLT